MSLDRTRTSSCHEDIIKIKGVMKISSRFLKRSKIDQMVLKRKTLEFDVLDTSINDFECWILSETPIVEALLQKHNKVSRMQPHGLFIRLAGCNLMASLFKTK